MELFIHIGSDKCGSTAIQSSLFQNRKLLAEDFSTYVPICGLVENEGHVLCFNNKRDEYFSLLIDELKIIESKYEKAVISWEGIHFIPYHELIEKFSELIQFKPKVIYYIRDQAEIIQSLILQQWKREKCGSLFEKFLPANRNYHKTAQHWYEFTGNKPDVIVFDRKRFQGGDVLLDLYSRICPDFLNYIKLSEDNINESLTYEAGYIMALLYKNFGFKPKEREIFLKTILYCQRSHKLSKYFLTENEVKEIREHYKKSNLELRNEYGADLLTNVTPCWRSINRNDSIHSDLLTDTLSLFDIPTLKFNNSYSILEKALKSGWHNLENWGAWANGTESIIKFRFSDQYFSNKSDHSDKISVRITGVFYHSVNVSSDITVNGFTYHNVDLRSFEFPINISELPKGGIVEISILNNVTTSSYSIEKTLETRELGFGIKSIVLINDKIPIDDLNPENLPILVSGDHSEISREALITGWYPSESWGAWAKGDESILCFKVDHLSRTRLQIFSESLHMNLTGRYFEAVSTKSDIEVNGIHYRDTDLRNFDFSIHAKDIPDNGLVLIRIRNHQTCSPFTLKISDDKRELSYGIHTLRQIDIQSKGSSNLTKS